MLVTDEARVMLAGDKPGNGVHRTGAVKGDDSRDILDAMGLESHADPGHTRRFHLKYTGGLTFREHLEDLRIVIRDVTELELRLLLTHQLHRIIQYSEVPQTKKVHF